MQEEFKDEELMDDVSAKMPAGEVLPQEQTTLEPEVSEIEEYKPEELPIDEPQIQSEISAPEADMDLVTVSPVEFSSFDELDYHLSQNPKQNLDIVQDVKMHITVELGRAKCSVKKILDFNKGSIVELNKVAGEQVELYANGKFVAYGEVIVIEDKFGLRVTSIAPQNIQS